MDIEELEEKLKNNKNNNNSEKNIIIKDTIEFHRHIIILSFI